MKILFIRHSIAENREFFEGDDLERELTKKGKKVANKFFEKISQIYQIDIIISSKAKRAIETAEILENYSKSKYIEKKELNPDGKFEDFIRVINDIKIKFDDIEVVAVVGHEPNLSEFISKLISNSIINVKLKKPSCVEIEYSEDYAQMRSFLTPKISKLKDC